MGVATPQKLKSLIYFCNLKLVAERESAELVSAALHRLPPSTDLRPYPRDVFPRSSTCVRRRVLQSTAPVRAGVGAEMARQIYKLTARKVATLKAIGRHGDGGGLYLSISGNGGRRWVPLSPRRTTSRDGSWKCPGCFAGQRPRSSHGSPQNTDGRPRSHFASRQTSVVIRSPHRRAIASRPGRPVRAPWRS